MSLELPGWVVDAFYLIGLPWPGLDEDELRGWGSDLRQFATEITEISKLSHGSVTDLANSTQASFAKTMAQHWDRHHEAIMAMREPMNVFADALDVAAEAVEVQKGVVIAAAVALAAAVIATQGEALVTFGAAEAEVPLEVEVAKKAINYALQELENRLLQVLIERAAQEITQHVGGTISKMLMGGLGTAMEVQSLKLDTQGVRRVASTLKTHANRTERSSSEAHRRVTNRKLETKSPGGKWHVVAVLEAALISIAEDIFRKLPGALHTIIKDTEKDLTKAAEAIEKADAKLAADAEHTPRADGGHHLGDDAGAGVAGAGGLAGVKPPKGPRGPDETGGGVRPKDPAEASRQPKDRKCVGDPIDVATGEMLLPQTDVALPGQLPLILKRIHLSKYRYGTWFGPSWASTLDQRLHLDAGGVLFVSDDGMRLMYPAPSPDQPVLPSHGPRWPLTWNGRPDGPIRITNPVSGETLIFDHPRQGVGEGELVFRLAAIEDRNTRRIDITWAEDHSPALITHHGGYRIAIDRHPSLPRITALRLLDSDGPGTESVLVRYGYDASGNLTEVTNSSGIPLRLTYDTEGRITSWTDRNGTSYGYAYDDAGRVVETTGSDGFLSGTLAYDEETRTTTVTNSLGHTSTYQHTAAHRLVRQTDPLGNTTVQQWDEANRLLLSVTDPLDRTTRYTYDTAENLTSLTRPDGSVASAVYNDLGLPVQITEPGGAMWRHAYDERGNRLTTTDPAGALTEYAYDASGDLITVTDGLGYARRVANNSAGLPISITDPLGNTTTCERDAFGHVTAFTDPLGNTTRFGWTTEGKPAWRELPDGTRETWSWDGEGNLTSHTDAADHTTSYPPTHFDLPASRTTPDGVTYTFTYDTELNLIRVTDPYGQTWDYAYNPAGRLISETDFNGRTLTYTHNAAGELLTRTNGAGQTITLTRDALGRVTEQRTSDGTITTFAYDPAGRLVRSTNAHTEVVREYDAQGRTLAETVGNRRMSYAYDALGRRTERRTPTSTLSTWTYDPAGLPQTLTTNGHILAFTHDALGRETARSFGTDTTLTQTWDPTSRLTAQSIAHGPEGARTLIQHRAYAYRPDGFLTEIDELTTGTRRFDLDPTGRITAVHARDWSETYAYDPTGNLTHCATPLTSGEDASRHFTGTLLRRSGRTTYEYDAQGRVTRTTKRLLNGQTRVQTYTWNAQDQLTETVTPDGTHWRYHYDPAGRRTTKQRLAPDGTVAEEIRFTWDGALLAEQTRSDGHTATW
ncbi:MAG: RHS repeat protein, partial [Streptomycetaceae bacterium]|nr:RHS repeat protein [Streptomycetaceae bacterium]